jgi:hypothetical protein
VTPRHGVDNWKLVEYEWDPETGEALLTYEHDDGRTEVVPVWHDRWLHRASGPVVGLHDFIPVSR